MSSWLLAVPGPPLVTRLPDSASGTCFGLPGSPWLASFPPMPPPTLARLCSAPSQVLFRHPTSAVRSSSSVQILSFPTRPRHDSQGGPQTSQVPAMDFRTCDGALTPRGSSVPRQSGTEDAAFGTGNNLGTPEYLGFVAQFLACAFPYRRLTSHLAMDRPRLGARVVATPFPRSDSHRMSIASSPGALPDQLSNHRC